MCVRCWLSSCLLLSRLDSLSLACSAVLAAARGRELGLGALGPGVGQRVGLSLESSSGTDRYSDVRPWHHACDTTYTQYTV
jgi:hypothetical protein